MLRRFFPCLAFLSLAALPAALRAADAKSTEPQLDLVVQVQSVDGLLAQLKYLGRLAGREEEATQLQKMIETKAGPKGFEGVDTKRPAGLYGMVDQRNAIDSTLVVLVPVADDKDFVELLKHFNLKVEKRKADDIYEIDVDESPFGVFFRISNHYAYFTVREVANLEKSKLIDPATIFSSDPSVVGSIKLRIDRIDDQYKQSALGFLDNKLADLKEERRPGETDAQRKVRGEALDAFGKGVATVLQDGRELSARLNIDRHTGDLTSEVTLTAKPDTKLAASIGDLKKVKSSFGELLRKDSAFSILLAVPLPEKIREQYVELAEVQMRKEMQAVIFDALDPFIKNLEPDGLVQLRGPTADKHYTALLGVELKDGKMVEKSMRDFVAKIPADKKENIKLDADKVGETSITRIDVKDAGANWKQNFGDAPLYVAFRSDALLAAVGEHGLADLKEALATEPKAALPLQLSVSVGRLGGLAERNRDAYTRAAGVAFAQDKGSDKVLLTIQGGDALQVRFDMKLAIVTFLSEMEKATKEGK